MVAERNCCPPGCECTFAGENLWHLVTKQGLPVFTVLRTQHQEFSVDRVAKREAMRFRIARRRVEKEPGAFVGVLQFPRFATVGSLVDPRLVAITARHDIRRIRVKSLDVTKVEL